MDVPLQSDASFADPPRPCWCCLCIGVRYHYDLNFMTIHGKSRFPGLYIWLRDGKKVSE